MQFQPDEAPRGTCTFGEMLPVLMKICDVPEGCETRFIAKIRNFQRLGFPDGLAGGRGHAIHYTIEQVFDLALCAQSGLPPHYVIATVRAEWDNLIAAAQNGKSHIFHPPSALADLQNDPNAKANGLLLWPAGAIWKSLNDSGLFTRRRASRNRREDRAKEMSERRPASAPETPTQKAQRPAVTEQPQPLAGSALANDLLRGVSAITEYLGPAFTTRAVYHLAATRAIPVFRLPNNTTIYARKSELDRHFSAQGMSARQS